MVFSDTVHGHHPAVPTTQTGSQATPSSYDWLFQHLDTVVGTRAPRGLRQQPLIRLASKLILVLKAQGEPDNSITAGRSPTAGRKSGHRTHSDTGHSSQPDCQDNTITRHHKPSKGLCSPHTVLPEN